MGLFDRFKSNNEEEYEGKTSFTDLENLIKINNEIILDSDVVLHKNEKNEFKDYGIEIRKDNLVIDGNGFTIDGKNKACILLISGKNIIIKNIKFINGVADDGGAIKIIDGSVEIIDCEFINNKANDIGGGGAIHNKGQLKIFGSKFLKNVSKKNGGAIRNYQGNVEIIDCEFNDNKTKSNHEGKNSFGFKAPDGGGAAIFSEGQLKLIDTNFFNNEATHYGSAIYNDFKSDMTLERCEFKGNNTLLNGGTIFNYEEAHADIENCKFIQNISAAYGEDYYGGGAIYNYGQIDLKNSIFSKNTAMRSGGAINNHKGGIINIINCEFINNDAKNGGAIFTDEKSAVTLDNSNFEDNKPDDLQSG